MACVFVGSGSDIALCVSAMDHSACFTVGYSSPRPGNMRPSRRRSWYSSGFRTRYVMYASTTSERTARRYTPVVSLARTICVTGARAGVSRSARKAARQATNLHIEVVRRQSVQHPRLERGEVAHLVLERRAAVADGPALQRAAVRGGRAVRGLRANSTRSAHTSAPRVSLPAPRRPGTTSTACPAARPWRARPRRRRSWEHPGQPLQPSARPAPDGSRCAWSGPCPRTPRAPWWTGRPARRVSGARAAACTFRFAHQALLAARDPHDLQRGRGHQAACLAPRARGRARRWLHEECMECRPGRTPPHAKPHAGARPSQNFGAHMATSMS